MNKPHKHAELIKAWADGAQIQFRHEGKTIWEDIVHGTPGWLPRCEYRVKPEPPPDWHRGLTVGIRIAKLGGLVDTCLGCCYLRELGFEPEDFQ